MQRGAMQDMGIPMYLKICAYYIIKSCRVNGLDIAPQHAGLIFGISNTAGSLAGIFSPIVAGYIVTNVIYSATETV